MKKLFEVIFAISVALCLNSCNKNDWDGRYDDVFIYWGSGFNDLSGSLRSNVDEIASGILPAKGAHSAVLAVTHNTSSGYKVPTDVCVIRMYLDNGVAVRDTVDRYGGDVTDTDPAFFRDVLNSISTDYPSDHYSLLYSSHGSGWLPQKYYTFDPTGGKSGGRSVQSIGIQCRPDNSTEEMDFIEFASHIPFHMDCIILDACLMGGVEVAYELRNVTDYLISSTTEINSSGFNYKRLIQRIMQEHRNYSAFCQDYLDKGNDATISVVDCSGLENLASVTAGLVDKYRDAIDGINRNNVQRYYRKNAHWFYDFRDIFAKANADTRDLAMLDSALEKCVVCKMSTKSFMKNSSGFDILNYSGLSMYIPKSTWTELNGYYKTLQWNVATGLVE